MGLLRFVKKSIRNTLGRFGYEIRPLNRLGAPDAVVYNTETYADLFYSDRRRVDKYKREGISHHLQNLRTVLSQEVIPVSEDMPILDAGCGTGDCLRMLWDEYGCRRLTGTDFSDVVLSIARETCPQADLHKLDLMEQRLPEQFDLILCQQVIEHLVRPEDAIRYLLSMLSPQGFLLITVPDGRVDDFAGHIHFWSQESLPIFLRKELPGYEVRSGPLPDNVSQYALIFRQERAVE